MATGGEPFNNLLRDARHEVLPEIDFVAHARSLGAQAREGRFHRRAGARVHARALGGARRRSSSSTPIRSPPPTPAAPGGTSRSPLRPSARRSRRRAKTTRRRWRPSAWETEMTICTAPTPSAGPTTRSPGHRRRHAARDLPRRSEAKPASRGMEEKAISCPTTAPRSRPSSPSSASSSSAAGISMHLLRRSAREEFENAKAHIAMTKGAGAGGDDRSGVLQHDPRRSRPSRCRSGRSSPRATGRRSALG